MLGSQDTGQPQSPVGREKMTTATTPVNTVSGIPPCLLKHFNSLHVFTSQDCTFSLSGEPAGARPSKMVQSEDSLSWGDTGMSWNSIFYFQIHFHSVAQASQEHAHGLFASSSQVLELQDAAPGPLRASSVLQRSLSNQKFQHCLSFELKATARGELPQNPGQLRACPGQRTEEKIS